MKSSLFSATLVVYTIMRERKQITLQNTLPVQTKYIIDFICKENGRMKIAFFKDIPVTVWLDSRQTLGERKEEVWLVGKKNRFFNKSSSEM